MGSCCCPDERYEAPQPKIYTRKIVVVGPASVGKTTIIQQFITGKTKDLGGSSKSGTHKKNY